MERPPLTSALSSAEFRSWYWLKSELVAFCRAAGLSPSGSKRELAERIDAQLGGRQRVRVPRERRAAAAMPERFELSSEIGEGWRCSQALREFFREHVGASFHFNGALRDFIRTGAGRTLAEALAHYESSRAAPTREIGEQFEYNRHTRAFFTANPGATRQQARDAWWAMRGARKRP
jgi:hypothetical protein